MPYYPTLAEDIARAKEILAKGKAEADNDDLPEAVRAWLASQHGGGTIYGADIYAAYKLLESFVEVIETTDPKVCELALRARRMGEAMAAHDDAPPPSITCPRCGRTSYNRHDIAEKYCGACHLFHDQIPIGERADDQTEVIPLPLQDALADAAATAVGECLCRTRGCGHSARLHVGGICQACACGGWS